MALFPHDETPKPRAFLMLVLSFLLTVGGFAAFILASPLWILVAVIAALPLGWFFMEFFFGRGPR